jgi:hypothetical protein
LIHSRIASQARPSRPACGDVVQRLTRREFQRGAGRPDVTFSVPTAWPFEKGATSGSGARMLVLTLGRAAGGHRHDHGISGRPSRQHRLLALPDGGVATGCPGIKQLDGLEGGEAPVQQFLGLVGPGVFAGRAEHDGQQRARTRPPGPQPDWGNSRRAVATMQ